MHWSQNQWWKYTKTVQYFFFLLVLFFDISIHHVNGRMLDANFSLAWYIHIYIHTCINDSLSLDIYTHVLKNKMNKSNQWLILSNINCFKVIDLWSRMNNQDDYPTSLSCEDIYSPLNVNVHWPAYWETVLTTIPSLMKMTTLNKGANEATLMGWFDQQELAVK